MLHSANTASTNIRQRLESGAATLAAIDYRRGKTLDPTLGSGIERWIVDRELRELEGLRRLPLGQCSPVRRRRKGRVLLVKAKWWLRRTSLKKRAAH